MTIQLNLDVVDTGIIVDSLTKVTFSDIDEVRVATLLYEIQKKIKEGLSNGS
jgi:hypothetical protein